MKKFYSRFTPDNFKIVAIITLFLLDILNSVWLYTRINNYEYFQNVLNTSLEVAYGEGIQVLPPDYLQNLFDMMMQFALVTILLYIFIHLIIYFCYYKNVMFGYYYLKVMSWSAGIITFLMALGFTSEPKLAIFFIAAPVYLFVAYGLGLFPIFKKNKEQ